MLRLNSGEQRLVHGDCFATVGAVSNPDHMNELDRQGRSQRAGWAIARSIAVSTMNPVDHPHGGGEGRTSAAATPVTPWGKPTKGKKTRSNKRTQTRSSCRRVTPARSRSGQAMARSVWKGPFVDGYLLKKAEAARASSATQRSDQDLDLVVRPSCRSSSA